MHIWKTSWPEGCSTNSLGHTVFYCWCYIFFGMHDLKTLGWVPNHQVILNCLLGSAWKLNEHFRSTKFNDDGGKSDFMQGEFTTPPEAYMVCSWECEPLPWARCGGSFGWTWIRGSAHSHLSTMLWQTDEQAGLRFFFKVFLFPQDVYNSCRLEFLMSGKRTQAPNISHLLWQSQVLLERPTIARDSQSHVPTSTAAHRRRRHVFPGWWATCATPWLHMFLFLQEKYGKLFFLNWEIWLLGPSHEIEVRWRSAVSTSRLTWSSPTLLLSSNQCMQNASPMPWFGILRLCQRQFVFLVILPVSCDLFFHSRSNVVVFHLWN